MQHSGDSPRVPISVAALPLPAGRATHPMAGTASAPTAPSPHYGAAGCPPTGPADDTPGGRAARAAGCLLLAAGLALYAGHEAQLFAPPAAAAPAVLAPVATAAPMALADMTAAAEGGVHLASCVASIHTCTGLCVWNVCAS